MSTVVKGLSELQAFLDQLPKKMEKNIMRGAMRAGMNVMRAEVRANVPVKTGILKRGLKVSTATKGANVIASLKFTGKHAHIARWLEFGVVAHIINPKAAKSLSFGGVAVAAVHHPGFNARPLLRPALDSRAQDAVVAVGGYVKARLTKQGLDTSGVDIEAQ